MLLRNFIKTEPGFNSGATENQSENRECLIQPLYPIYPLYSDSQAWGKSGPKSDAAKWGIWSEYTLLATHPEILDTLTLVLLIPDIPYLYSVDPDQLASEETNWSGSTPSFRMWICISNLDQVIWLAEN